MEDKRTGAKIRSGCCSAHFELMSSNGELFLMCEKCGKVAFTNIEMDYKGERFDLRAIAIPGSICQEDGVPIEECIWEMTEDEKAEARSALMERRKLWNLEGVEIPF